MRDVRGELDLAHVTDDHAVDVGPQLGDPSAPVTRLAMNDGDSTLGDRANRGELEVACQRIQERDIDGRTRIRSERHPTTLERSHQRSQKGVRATVRCVARREVEVDVHQQAPATAVRRSSQTCAD